MAIKKTCAIILIAVFFTGICFAKDIPGKCIPNFAKVEDDFYRGGAPGARGLKCLKEAGVKTIVDFRGQPAEKASIREERKSAGELKINYINIPFGPSYSIPSDENIKTFLRIAANPKNRPIFVHCQHGRDRAGMMVAVYRIAVLGWPVKDAYEEARKLGLNNLYRDIKDFIFFKAESFKGEISEKENRSDYIRF